MSPLEHAFRPGRIGGLELPHRILMGSMHLGIESEPEGAALAAFYVERALGGAALIITGGAAVSRVGAGGRNYGFVNEALEAPKLRRLAHAVREAGGRIALQLFHAGRYGSDEYFGLQPLAPSAVPSRFSKSAPRAMSAQDIAQTLADFAAAAHRARELGFDAVEIMGSEGYLLNQFLSPLTNQRDDEWGGDFERRTRFPLALVRAVREAVGPGYPIIYRMSGADLMPGSTSDEETVAFARALATLGVDAIELGIGWHESSTPTVQYTVAPGAWLPYAARIRAAVTPVPVIASTRIHTLELAAHALANGQADFVALARPFLADPRLVAKGRAGRIEAINPCIACNQACIDRSLRDQRVSCMVNPRAGYEAELYEPPAPTARRGFAVIGGGPAGLEAARVLAVFGHRVVLYEAEAHLGGQFRLACRIPGKEDFARTIEYFERELRALRVDIRLGRRIAADSAAELDSYDGVIVASGVAPRRIDLPGAELPHVRAYPDAVRTSAEDPIAIIGAGGVGVDVAHLHSHSGQRVTLMCRGKIVGEHIGRSTRWVLLRALCERGVQMLTGVSYERIAREGVWIRERGEAPRLIEARTVVVAAGQESRDPLSAALERRGMRFRVVGGARVAAELDAVRAFREGALAARELAGA
ncbi:MAG: FAD-dependent oxidoreductase [Steroidobacteraceae bacterium]